MIKTLPIICYVSEKSLHLSQSKPPPFKKREGRNFSKMAVMGGGGAGMGMGVGGGLVL